MFKIIDKYIYKELFLPFLFGVLAFSLILGGGGVLPTLIREANKYGIAFNYVIELFFYQMPEIMVYTFPMSMLLSALLAFGRLSSDSEVVAFRAGTISINRLVLPALLVGLIVSLLSFAFSEIVLPYANTKSEAMMQSFKSNTSSNINIKENINLTEYEKGYLKRIIYAKYLQGSVMNDVSISEFEEGQFRRVIFAKKAIFEEGVGWSFFDGIIHQFSSDNPESVFAGRFKKEEVNLKVEPRDFSDKEKDPKAMSFLELKQYIELKERTGAQTKELFMELYRKLAFPFASFLFVLIGSPLGLRPQRSSSSAVGLGLSLLIIFAYYIITAICEWLTMADIFSPFVGAWLPNLITVLIGLYFLRKANL